MSEAVVSSYSRRNTAICLMTSWLGRGSTASCHHIVLVRFQNAAGMHACAIPIAQTSFLGQSFPIPRVPSHQDFAKCMRGSGRRCSFGGDRECTAVHRPRWKSRQNFKSSGSMRTPRFRYLLIISMLIERLQTAGGSGEIDLRIGWVVSQVQDASVT